MSSSSETVKKSTLLSACRHLSSTLRLYPAAAVWQQDALHHHPLRLLFLLLLCVCRCCALEVDATNLAEWLYLLVDVAWINFWLLGLIIGQIILYVVALYFCVHRKSYWEKKLKCCISAFVECICFCMFKPYSTLIVMYICLGVHGPENGNEAQIVILIRDIKSNKYKIKLLLKMKEMIYWTIAVPIRKRMATNVCDACIFSHLYWTFPCVFRCWFGSMPVEWTLWKLTCGPGRTPVSPPCHTHRAQTQLEWWKPLEKELLQ